MEKLKTGKVIPLFQDQYIELSNGALADMNTNNIQEAIDGFDNLLSMIVMEHFEEILKTSVEDQNYDRAVEIIENEVGHLVNNEFAINHGGALYWILTTLALGRLDCFLTEVTKNQNNI